MTEYILETENIHYRYGDGTYALCGLSLCFGKSVTTAVLGGNGAGKSTLFLTLNGILRPEKGVVKFKGKPLDYTSGGVRLLRKSVGVVFQDPDDQLFSTSVFRDVSFGPMNLKLPESEVRERVEKALRLTGTIDLEDRPVHNLSFGQKKRVAVAGVLAMQPEVLVLDEPTAGLDPTGVSEIMRMLRGIQEDMGLTVIISTHDIDIVPLYCDYVYVLDHGKKVMEGTPQEVFHRPGKLREINLRLPRIGHLVEILDKEDGFGLGDGAYTISGARRLLNEWRAGKCQKVLK